MSHLPAWPWAVFFLLGAYHGINPSMGWLFATALGMQKKSAVAVWQSLVPIAVGHFIAIGVVVAAAVAAGALLPLQYVKAGAACILLAFGLQRLIRKRHPRWGGMQIGFRDLCIWSFLMASAHGAGFMLLPILLRMSAPHRTADMGTLAAHLHGGEFARPWAALTALLIHTLSYLVVTGLIALVVYENVGLEVLRKTWVNLDLIWAAALILTAGLTRLITA
jgi:hypothetical protein